ncbi:uncharacterized protein [Littorina saxatilis]|uniref:Phytanoyl-CoA dioxygenase n=1 Tax=Littorina saxatilis TaxID=31220 RepID=A0AAN9G4W5_9CAEN
MALLKPRHRDDLRRQGYTVVKGVLTEEECTQYIQEYRDWIKDNFDEGLFPHCSNSLIQRYSIGHLSPSWSVRLKAQPVFAELWETQELLSSTDAVVIGRPPEEGEEAFHTLDKSWLHNDQGAGRIGLHAYQGAVYLETANMDDWVFECMDGSHKLLEKFYEEHPEEREASINSDKDHLRLEEKHVKWFRERGCLRRRVAVPARGSIVLWDSRLVHNNVRPIRGRSNPGRWRWAVMVCMTPACWADKDSLRLKRKAYRELRMTTHWPSNGVRLFPNALPEGAPRAKHPLKKLPEVAKTLEALQLAGVMPYKKLQKKSEAGAGSNNNLYTPKFSPDYKPPKQPPSSNNCGWIVVAVVSTIVCVVSIFAFVYIYNNPQSKYFRMGF